MVYTLAIVDFKTTKHAVLEGIYIPDRCNFETNRHNVSELIAKIPKNAKTEAILWKLEKLSKSTFFERTRFNMDYVT